MLGGAGAPPNFFDISVKKSQVPTNIINDSSSTMKKESFVCSTPQIAASSPPGKNSNSVVLVSVDHAPESTVYMQ